MTGSFRQQLKKWDNQGTFNTPYFQLIQRKPWSDTSVFNQDQDNHKIYQLIYQTTPL